MRAKISLLLRKAKHIAGVIREELSFSEEQANERIEYANFKPHLVKPHTVLDKHDHMRVRNFIRFLRRDKNFIPVIKYTMIILLVCLPIALGYTIYQRMNQQVIYGTYIKEYPHRNFTIQVQDKFDPTKMYNVDYGLAKIYDRNGKEVQVRKTLFENDPTTGWGVGNELEIRVERIDDIGIYQANHIIDHSIPTPNTP